MDYTKFKESFTIYFDCMLVALNQDHPLQCQTHFDK